MKVNYFDKRGEVWLDFKDHTGSRHRVPSGCTTKAEAERKAPLIVALKVSAVASIPTKSPIAAAGGMTLGNAFKKGMIERDAWTQSKDKDSLGDTFRYVAAYWGEDEPVSKATNEATMKWRSVMLSSPGKRKGTTLSASTINHRLSMLSVLLEVAKAPPHGVRHMSTKGTARQRRITDKEVQSLKDWLIANVHRSGSLAMCHLIQAGIETGARQGELLGLAWADVADTTLTFRETKNSTTRTIPLTPALRRVLDARRGLPQGPFRDLTQDRATDLWAQARAAIGLADDQFFVFHGLRHECLSRMGDRNVNATTIQAVAGHENITTTQRYVHASLGAMNEAFGIAG